MGSENSQSRVSMAGIGTFPLTSKVPSSPNRLKEIDVGVVGNSAEHLLGTLLQLR